LEGQAITVVASGFLDPSNNSNGAQFGLYAALATGGNLVELNNTSSIDDIFEVSSLTVYPNPVTTEVNVSFNLKQDSDVQIDLVNLLGSQMVSDRLNYFSGNYQHTMNVATLPEGIYIMVIRAGDEAVSRKVQIVR